MIYKTWNTTTDIPTYYQSQNEMAYMMKLKKTTFYIDKYFDLNKIVKVTHFNFFLLKTRGIFKRASAECFEKRPALQCLQLY